MNQPPRLVHGFDLDVRLREPVDLGRSSAGNRWFIEVAGGRVTGPRLGGEILPGGGDWAVERRDGTWMLDARYAIRLEDGTPVEVHNRGYYVEAESGSGHRYYLTTPQFRVGSTDDDHLSPHEWLERTVFVGEAFEIGTDHIRIEVHLVEHAMEP